MAVADGRGATLGAGGRVAPGEAEPGAFAEAGAALGGRFREAPMLAVRVAAGELPPVEERTPFDPVVQEMLADCVGRYGGTLRVSEAIAVMNQRGGKLTTQSASQRSWIEPRRHGCQSRSRAVFLISALGG